MKSSSPSGSSSPSSPSEPSSSRGIGARITQIRSRMTQGKFADSLGIHKNTLIRYEKEERLPDSELLTRIYEVYGVDPTWLLTGESRSPAATEEPPTFLIEDYVPIPIYGSLRDQKERELLFIKKSWGLRQFQVEPEDLRLIDIEGESMKPTLAPGDMVIVNCKDTSVRDGIYALHIEDALIIKRLQRFSGSSIKVISDNPAYESWTINPSESAQRITIVGRIIRVSRRI
jgi:transcriptional regulator with XRE-family HTH domain